MKKIEIAYLCNQEKDCNTSLICGKECNHTLDVEHAKNFAMCFESEEVCKYIETMKDLVEVVRCKDCVENDAKYGNEENWCLKFGYTMHGDDFCSYGEREAE